MLEAFLKENKQFESASVLEGEDKIELEELN